MAEKKSVIDEAYPGDIVGLHTGTFKIGDTFKEGKEKTFRGSLFPPPRSSVI